MNIEKYWKGSVSMKKLFSKFIRFRSEPHSLECPRCKILMDWNPAQGPGTGGWKCSRCGIKIDYKG